MKSLASSAPPPPPPRFSPRTASTPPCETAPSHARSHSRAMTALAKLLPLLAPDDDWSLALDHLASAHGITTGAFSPPCFPYPRRAHLAETCALARCPAYSQTSSFSSRLPSRLTSSSLPRL